MQLPYVDLNCKSNQRTFEGCTLIAACIGPDDTCVEPDDCFTGFQPVFTGVLSGPDVAGRCPGHAENDNADPLVTAGRSRLKRIVVALYCHGLLPLGLAQRAIDAAQARGA